MVKQKKVEKSKKKSETIKKQKKEQEKSDKIIEKNIEIQKTLIENSISLQKVVADSALKFEKLSNQISELLTLFEKSAKSVVVKQDENKEFLEKINKLLEQNKTITDKMIILEKKLEKQKTEEIPELDIKEQEIPIPKPLPEI